MRRTPLQRAQSAINGSKSRGPMTGIFHLYVRETRPRNMREFMQTTTMFRQHIRPVASHCCLDQGEPLLP
jgi:hypothetical protein